MHFLQSASCGACWQAGDQCGIVKVDHWPHSKINTSVCRRVGGSCGGWIAIVCVNAAKVGTLIRRLDLQTSLIIQLPTVGSQMVQSGDAMNVLVAVFTAYLWPARHGSCISACAAISRIIVQVQMSNLSTLTGMFHHEPISIVIRIIGAACVQIA